MKSQDKYHGENDKEEFVFDTYKYVQRRKTRHSLSFLDKNTKSFSRIGKINIPSLKIKWAYYNLMQS